mmetsp:Transcript_21333/g.43874  ORF Transcript_21333/g.43874 Transcript_21333/m.43874 type:complete len:731 (+) Transcript_21333:291-2483(+)
MDAKGKSKNKTVGVGPLAVTVNNDDDNNNSNEPGLIEDQAVSKSVLSLTPLPPPTPSVSTFQSKPIASDSTERKTGVEASNHERKEEERVDYFLLCFAGVEATSGGEKNTKEHPKNKDTTTPSRGRHYYRSSDDTGDEENQRQEARPRNSRTSRTKHTRSKKQNRKRKDKPAADIQVENVLTGRNNDESVAVVTHSLLDDDVVLQSLRRSLYRTNQRSFDASASRSEGSLEEVHPQRDGIEQQQEQQDTHHDPTVASFVRFLEFAQTERLKKPHARPYLILGLFANLSDVRSDLEWAQDAAYRRQAGKPYVAWTDYYAKEREGVFQRPIFTSLTLIICTVMMLLAFHKNDWKMEPLKSNPLIGPNPDVLLELGALKGSDLIEDGKWWLLITPIFLHAGIAHLLLNASILVLLCRTIERNHGWLHTGILFLASGVFGNMISALLQPSFILVGASGGIYGLLGACVADIVLNSRFFFLVLEERAQEESKEQQRRSQKKHNEKQSIASGERAAAANDPSVSDLIVRAYDPVAIQYSRRRVRLWCYFSLVCDLFLNSLVGLLPFVDNFAHLGGLIFGFFVSLSSLRLLSASSFDYRKSGQNAALGRWCHGLRIVALRCGGFLSALFLLFVAIVFLRRSDGTTSPCPNCRYASCISLPRPWKPNDKRNWWTCDGCGGVSAQVYKGRGPHEEYYVTVDVFCPLGNTIKIDIIEEHHTELEQVNAALPDLCRDFCEK